MKRYAVTYHDDFTGRDYTLETIQHSERAAKHYIYSQCGDVDIIQVDRIENN